MDIVEQLNDWAIFGIIFVTIFFVLGIAETIRNYTGKPPESTRKFVHVFIGLIICFCPILFKVNIQIILLSSLFSYFSLLPLLGAVALSFAVIIMKKLLSYDTPPTCSFYLHFFVALIYLPFVLFNWQQPSLNLWIMLIGMGFCGGIAQILLTNAYRLSSVNLLQPFDYTAIIWAITFGLIFFNDYPDRYVIIGSIVIVISTYYIIYREAKLGKKITSINVN